MTNNPIPPESTPNVQPVREWYWVVNALMMLLVVLGTMYGVHRLFEDGEELRTLGMQVNELALRARMLGNTPQELRTPNLTKVPPRTAALITKFQLKQVTAAGLYPLTRAQGLVAPQISEYKWEEPRKPGEVLPGLAWKWGKLHHPWGDGGVVDVYRNGGLILIAFSNLPNNFCDEVTLRFNSGGNSYVFACNDRLIAVDQDISWEVTAADMRAKHGAPGDPDAMTF